MDGSGGLVVLRKFRSEPVARLAASALEGEGVSCIVSRDDAGGAYPFLVGTLGIRLLVASSDENRAREILTAMEFDETA
jgi:hypothetical protein